MDDQEYGQSLLRWSAEAEASLQPGKADLQDLRHIPPSGGRPRRAHLEQELQFRVKVARKWKWKGTCYCRGL